MEKGRIAALDAGRTIAVVGVVAVHLSFQFPNLPDSVALIARMGQYGVQLFFVISAITIFMTLEADRERFSAARHVTLRFYIKRFFRIAPQYYVAIAIYGLISWGALRSGYERAWVLGAHSPADILLNVLFLHSLSPSAINNVVPGGWSIGVEMMFYLLAPLIFFFTLNGVRLAIASVTVLAVSAAVMWLVGCNGAQDCIVANNTFLYFWPPVQVPCFIVGMWAWFAFRPYLAGEASVTRRVAWLSVTMAFAFALATAALGVWLAKGHEFAPFFAACAGAGLLLVLCSHRGRGTGPIGQRLFKPCAIAIGRESYGIYLWHFICTYATFHFFERVFGRTNEDMSFALFIVTVAVVLAVSYVLSRLSGRFVQAWASRFSHRLLAYVDERFRVANRH
jgi:peptidoglycan/LPS O-acetylase OafA/YrhL